MLVFDSLKLLYHYKIINSRYFCCLCAKYLIYVFTAQNLSYSDLVSIGLTGAVCDIEKQLNFVIYGDTDHHKQKRLMVRKD